jgi:predicted DNA repair protein MutK
MPKFAKEIVITAISYTVLCLLWYFFLGEFITLNDQSLSTIGLALSAAVGGLTAIVVSFTLIVWQLSRRDRSDNFIHFRETLDRLDNVFSENVGSLMGMLPELSRLLLVAHRVSAVNAMPIEKITELFNAVEEKLQVEKFNQVEVCKKISNLLTPLLSYCIAFTVSCNMVSTVLRLRRLLYRLLAVLIAGVTFVALANTATSLAVSDTINLPLVAVLIAWFIYVLVSLAREIKRISWEEDELKKLRPNKLEEWRLM